jgi:hypothetical protein
VQASIYMIFGFISKAAYDLKKRTLNSIKKYTCPKIIGTSSDCVHANASSTGGNARDNLLVWRVGDTSPVHPLVR